MRRLLRRVGGAAMALALLGTLGARPAAAAPKLYVTNSTGDNIHVIDLKTFRVLGEIKTGERQHGAAVSGDGRRLFSSVEGDHTLLRRWDIPQPKPWGWAIGLPLALGAALLALRAWWGCSPVDEREGQAAG